MSKEKDYSEMQFQPHAHTGNSSDQSPIIDNLAKLDVKDVASILRKRFEIERISRHFRVVPYSFEGSSLQVSEGNSILLEFPTLKKRYPDYYDSSCYRLLLLLGLRTESGFDDDFRLELQDIFRKDNIDKIIIWTCLELPQTRIQAIKGVGADFIRIRARDIEKLKSIAQFIPTDRRNYDYAVTLNITVDLLLKRLKKLFHLILSEIAAPIYNSMYGSSRVATHETMKFEEKIVTEVADKLMAQKRVSIAVDVGCGTGRHTFPLADVFREVYAFDFSPRMIDEAKREKRRREITNIYFSVADLEYEEIIDESSFYGKVDLVLGSFGLGSFIEETSRMLRRFYNWLKPGGYAVISFYNNDSILNQLKPNWRDTSLSAHLDGENSTLKVELSAGAVFHIYCKPFSEAVKGAIMGVFGDIQRTYSYPTLMALMPNSLLENPLARNLFIHVDDYLSTNDDFFLGHYVTIIVKKAEELPAEKKTAAKEEMHHRILGILKDSKSRFEIIEHAPVLSINDVIKQVGYHEQAMIKTVVFKEKASNKLIIVVLLSEKRVDRKKIAAALGVAQSKIKFASEKELVKIGFPLGGISPFGFPENMIARAFVDQDIRQTEQKWLFMGAGENNKTLKLTADDFLEITSNYESMGF